MKHIKYHRVLLLLALALLTAQGVRGQELVSTILSRDTILIGDHVEWVTKLKLPKGISARIDSMSGYVVPGVELIRPVTIDTVRSNREYTDVVARAVVTSFDSGSYVMPPVVIWLYKGEEVVDTLRMKEVMLEVGTIPIDTATYQMADIRGQIDYPVTFYEVMMWVVPGLALIGVIVLAVWLVLRRKRSHNGQEKLSGPKDPPHITALRELDRIGNARLWQNGKEKLYYTEISETLRVYIEGRFRIKTMERTSNEILSDLAKVEMAQEEYERVSGLFSVADLVKFAKYRASVQENEEALPNAVRFVNDTFSEEIKDGGEGDE